MSYVLGGSVATAPVSEYGKTDVDVDVESKLFEGVAPSTICWMSHTDYIERAPEGFKIIGHTPVCPVAATSHGRQGQNHMAYNRCVGTRYCANNCPYKVRRFNWFLYNKNDEFDYHMNDDLGRMVLNPDVNVRSRGVMEKCSMCIQRIQAGKLTAKMEKRALKDGDIKMACQQACSANAIIFGDKNDPNSEVAKALRSERIYYVLEEINVQPGIGYMTKVRNIDSKTKEAHHG